MSSLENTTMNARHLDLVVYKEKSPAQEDEWEKTKEYVARVIAIAHRNPQLLIEIERGPLIKRGAFKRAACDILGLTLDEAQDGQDFQSFGEFAASAAALSNRWKLIENIVSRPEEHDSKPTRGKKQKKRSRNAAAEADSSGMHGIYENAREQVSNIKSDDDDGPPANIHRMAEMRNALDEALKKCQDHIEQLSFSKQKYGTAPIMIGSPLELLKKILCDNHALNSESFVEGIRSSFAALDIKLLNACQRLKINSPFLISFRIWTCVKAEMQGAQKAQHLELYDMLWQQATSTETHSDATRDKYCRIGKWLSKNPWGVFVDLKYAEFEAHITTWTQLLAQVPPFREKSQRLTEMMVQLTTNE